MDACVPEADTGERRGKHHAFARFAVVRIGNRAHEIFAEDAQRFEAGHIAERVCALRGGPG